MFLLGQTSDEWQPVPLVFNGGFLMRQSATSKQTTLYVITNTTNGKRYIGVTVKRLSQRWASHVWAARHRPQANSALHKAIVKYGPEVFTISTVRIYHGFPSALRGERALIKELKPEYNCTSGGDGSLGYKHTPEMRTYLSSIKKGRPSHMKGKKHTPEALKRMSDALKGKPAYWKGKKVPEHVTQKLREGYDAWKKTNPIVSRDMSSIHRAVRCLDDGLLFNSITAAAQYYDCDTSSISEICNRSGHRKTAAGRVFRYAEESNGGTAEAQAVKIAAYHGQRRHLTPGGSRRAVVCLDDGMTFSCVKDAAKHYRVPAWTISRICKGVKAGARGPKRAGGRQFSFLKGVGDGLSLAS